MEEKSKNPISRLQELCVSRRLVPPLYEELFETGPGYPPLFWIRVEVSKVFYGGAGKTKKIAKTIAAQNALDDLENTTVPAQPAPVLQTVSEARPNPFVDYEAHPRDVAKIIGARDGPAQELTFIVAGEYMPPNVIAFEDLREEVLNIPGLFRLQCDHEINPIPRVPEPYSYRLIAHIGGTVTTVEAHAISLNVARKKAYAKLCILNDIRITRNDFEQMNP